MGLLGEAEWDKLPGSVLLGHTWYLIHWVLSSAVSRGCPICIGSSSSVTDIFSAGGTLGGRPEWMRLSKWMAKSRNWFRFLTSSWHLSSDCNSGFSPLQKSNFSVSSTHTIWGARVRNASAYAAVFLCRRLSSWSHGMSEYFAQNVLWLAFLWIINLVSLS